ncbi:MFS transporter [Acinetobacter sp. LoGeW2-3]|uniref:MFS transporter n=1 Tax=Acinetobacter sp. LoGeW2-3 TaxID=1808001 RepID=UPI00148A6815|nr:MFS transporter [Acinetobacter sp. LoGeW2-3]
MSSVESNLVHAPLSIKFISSFILLSILAGLGMGVFRVLTSLYGVELKASGLQLGLISAAQSIGILLMALPIGVLVKRLGSLKVFTIGSLVGASLFMFGSLFHNAWALVLITALVSFVMPMRFVSINTVFLTHLRRLGPSKAGWFRGSHMTGFFLIVPSLGVFFISTVGHQKSFWCVAALFLIALILAPLCFEAKSQVERDAQPKFKFKEILEPLQLIKTYQPLRTVCLLEILTSIATNTFGFFIVVIAIQNFAFAEHSAVMLLTVQGIVFVGSLFGLGGLAEWVGYQKFYLIGLSCVSGALLALALLKDALGLWPASALLGLGLGILHIANFMSFAKVGEATEMTKVSPILALVGPAGGLLGGVIGMVFGSSVGLQWLFLPIAIAFAGMAIYIYFSQRFLIFIQSDTSHTTQQLEGSKS